MVSLTHAFCAVLGPWLVAVTVKVSCSPLEVAFFVMARSAFACGVCAVASACPKVNVTTLFGIRFKRSTTRAFPEAWAYVPSSVACSVLSPNAILNIPGSSTTPFIVRFCSMLCPANSMLATVQLYVALAPPGWPLADAVALTSRA